MPRRLLLVLAALLAALAVAWFVAGRDDPGERGPAGIFPGAGVSNATLDPIAYDDERRGELEARAAAGHSHVLYAKSPGGAVASARRTAAFRPLVERAAHRHGVDADTLEALVMLESAGRPDARASDDLDGAVGLTQILAETGRNLLGLRIDVHASERLTRGIARGRRVRAREARRRVVDERFDPAKALDAAARYLVFARERLGREDLAVAAYHMGVGNLQGVLAAYGEADVPYAQLYFDSSPLRHAGAWQRLSRLGDDSSTYLWRIGAAREILRLHRSDPGELERREALHSHKNSAEEVLHPPDSAERFGDPLAVSRAREARELGALRAGQLRAHGLRIDPRMGELARRLRQSPRLYRALRPAALSTLLTIGAGVRQISGTAPLTVTSTVRDEQYQRTLLRRNPEATRGFSLHTTGWAFDVAREYAGRGQAMAFQFMLDRLTALNLIAWVREPGAIHVTVAPDAAEVLG
jgi:soluble lytic murein transglycosylase-like protein